MTSIKRLHDNQHFYVKISKKLIDDTTLSSKAYALIIYLLGRPPGWKVIISHLKNLRPREGRDFIYSALKELQEHGYVRRITLREKGKIVGGDYVFSDEIITDLEMNEMFPLTENPVTVEPVPANPVLARTTLVINDINNNIKEVIKEKENKQKKKTSTAAPSVSVLEVFQYWVLTMGKNSNTVLSPESLRKIASALKKRSVEDIKKMIDGCASSKFNMENHHNDIELILRNESKMDYYFSLYKPKFFEVGSNWDGPAKMSSHSSYKKTYNNRQVGEI